jgi:hypothetical protein
MAVNSAFNDRTDNSTPGGIRTESWEHALAAAAKTLEGVTATSEAGKSAADLAEAVIGRGYGRLFGGAEPTTGLPQSVITPACTALGQRIVEAERAASALRVTWGHAGRDQADAVLAGLLQTRMDAWAATAELVAAIDGSDDAAATVLDQLEDAVDRFDRKLADQEDLLATLVGTGVLDGWRRELAAAYRDPLPWWLDGRLEARAEAMARSVDRMARKSESGAAKRDPAAVTLPFGHPLAVVRPVFVQQYAAAAAAGPAVESRPFRWRDTGGEVLAALIPPPRRAAVPEAAVVEFTTVAGKPAADLVGRVAILGGWTIPIMPVGDTAGAAVVARFPGDVLRSEAADAVLSLGLVGDEPWKPVVE